MGEHKRNRHEKRAAEAVADKLEDVPNVSNTDEACGNCGSAVDADHHNKVMKVHRRNSATRGKQVAAAQDLEPDEVMCLHEPGGGKGMMCWGWCRKWNPKAKAIN